MDIKSCISYEIMLFDSSNKTCSHMYVVKKSFYLIRVTKHLATCMWLKLLPCAQCMCLLAVYICKKLKTVDLEPYINRMPWCLPKSL